MKKRLVLEQLGEDYLLSQKGNPHMRVFLKYLYNESSYSIISEREVPAWSGAPKKKSELVSVGDYFTKDDLKSKVYLDSLDYAEKLAKEHKLNLENKVDLS